MSDLSTSPIVCPTTSWYTRRMLMMFVMLAAFAGWFYKDFRWGYPKKAEIYAEYQKIIELADGKVQWTALSKARGWDDPPDEITPDKIGEQGKFAAGLSLGALAVLVTFLVNRGKKLTADATSFTPPGRSESIPFTAVVRVDKTRWKHKGLAFAYYKNAAGVERKAVIDDLKYGGADQVLDRLLAHFGGDLIDVAEDPPATVEAAPTPPPTSTPV